MNEMWNQFFSLRHDKPRTLQLQIRQQLIDAITNGLIGPNEPLPSSRNLAKALNVDLNKKSLIITKSNGAGDSGLFRIENKMNEWLDNFVGSILR